MKNFWILVVSIWIFFVFDCNAVPFRSFRQTVALPELAVKATTNWTQWEECPDGTYIFGVSFLLSSQSGDTLKGIRLACKRFGESYEERVEIGAVATNYSGRSTLWNQCDGNGFAVGLQQRVSPNIWSGKPGSPSIPEIWKSGVIEAVLYCDDFQQLTKVEQFTQNSRISAATWRKPFLCGWGEVLHSIRAQFGGPNLDKMLKVEIQCWPGFDDSVPERTNRILSGRIVESSISNSKIAEKRNGKVYDHHFTTEMDSPYYYKWKFCENDHYVTGMQIKHGTRGVGLLCSDMTRPKPRTPQIIQMNGNEAEWEASSDELSEQIECEGVAIGFQVKYNEDLGIQAIRLICSFTSGPPDQLAFVESRFKNAPNVRSSEGEWQQAQMCGRNQVICGFKAYTHRFGEYKDLLEHFKVKCCQVPEIADVCFPTDRFELLVECDATHALAETTCTYTQSEGMSIAHSLSGSEKRDLEFHQSLGREWSIVESETARDSESTMSSNTTTESQSDNEMVTTNESSGTGISDGSDKSSSRGSGTSNSKSTGTGVSSSQSTSRSEGNDKMLAKSQRKGDSRSEGESESNSRGTSSGKSRSSGSTNSRGSTDETSQSETEGTSRGSLKATTQGSSDSRSNSEQTSKSNSHSSSQSDRNSQSSSSTHGMSLSLSHSHEVGVNAFGFLSGSVRTSFEAGYQGSWTSGSETGSERGSSRNSETSSGSTNTANSETSNSNTNQETSDQSNSKTGSKSNQVRQDNTESTGTEENTGETSQTGQEKNKQRTQSTDSEKSETDTTRINTENQDSNTKNSQTETGQSETTDERDESRNTTMITRNQEFGKGRQVGSTTETGYQQTGSVSRDKALERTGSSTTGISDSGGKRFSTGFSWDKASTSTWNMERSTEVRMTVPPGMNTRLYQAVGHCAFYTVRTTFYKRVDSSAFNVDLNPPAQTHETPNTRRVILDPNQEYEYLTA